MGDWNALCKSDYSEAEWNELAAVRKKNRWEAVCLLIVRVSNLFQPKSALYEKIKERGYRDAFPGRGAANKLATVWANTRIDWIFLSPEFPGW